MKILIALAAFAVVIALIAVLKGTTVTVDSYLKRTGNGAEAYPAPLELRPWTSKINPWWWLGNDEQSAQGNTFTYKYLRNIAQNFRWYVIGVADRPHKVSGLYMSPWGGVAAKRSDMRPVESGLQLAVVWCGPIPCLPWISGSWKYLTFYAGWEPAGGFGLMLIPTNSDIKNKEVVDAAYFDSLPKVTLAGNQP